MLISDLSGIIAEYMTLNRPIIYIDPDESMEPWEDSDMPKELRAGHVVKRPEELIEALKDSISCPDRFRKKRKDLISILYYKFCLMTIKTIIKHGIGNNTLFIIDKILNQ